ncbi:MAG TPA: hypothetical protein DCM28_13610 [Phycisphaerales bacterium]|nr:hypothetical protein [Phycisphaerales bacterium]HCD33997.1 hypothetical protein [Phycisphaerales bacterium]|tara:strand:+ start:54999 stop:56570 length:1572 start_codon:yes stop_codon:yes gene_type:complete
MQIDKLLSHHGLTMNPFVAEEARHDPVFEQLLDESMPHHPDFAKILGQVHRPSAAVVFGEKGSGKTAIRLHIGKQVRQHNEQNPDSKALLVPYDDLNPVLDRVLKRKRTSRKGARADVEELLKQFRLEEHQDVILSLAMTRLINGLLGENGGGEDPTQLPADAVQSIRKLPKRKRVDLLVMAMLYDAPRSGDVVQRFEKLRKTLRIYRFFPLNWRLNASLILSVIGGGGVGLEWLCRHFDLFGGKLLPPVYLYGAGALAVLGLAGLITWLMQTIKSNRLAKKIHHETPAIERTIGQFKEMLPQISPKDLAGQSWPAQGAEDAKNSRYELTSNLMEIIPTLGYTGMMVLVDRLDEPTVISSNAERMRSVLWPMLDNKFLQQPNIGMKMLLPIELRHMLVRESPAFFQEARLDKQNLIERLTWSGATLFDLCTSRLRACQKEGADEIYLTDLFEADVSREMVVDALDQMHQPRDAFKFLYSVIQEHCRMIPEDQGKPLIARITLETVRRDQARRVQELYRGLSPA